MDELPPPSADPFSAPPQPPFAPPSAEVWVQPEDPKRRRKGVLLAVGVGVLVVIAAIVGVLVLRSGGAADAYSLQAAAESASRADKVAFEMRMEAMGLDVEMTARVDNEAQLMAFTASMPVLSEDGAIEMVMDVGEKVVYMDASLLPGGDESPTKWLSFDMSQMPGMEEELSSITGSNPLDAAALFQDAAAVEDLGLEDLDGEQVKHYRVTVDVAELTKAQPGLFDQLEGIDLPSTVDYDVWVTEDNQLRRMSFELDVLGGPITTEMTVTAVGDIEPVVLPPADEVTDMTDLLGGA